MREAWYVVEVYSLMCVWGTIAAAINSKGNTTLLAITAAVSIIVLVLAWRTFRGSRLASRVLSLYIVFNAGLNIYSDAVGSQPIDVYRVYMLALYVYLVAGAIKLWRIKELPTRFTDPPTEDQTYH